MKKNISKKITMIFLFIAGILLVWSGLIYATKDTNNFHFSGILVAIIGYCFIPCGMHIFETIF